MLAQPALLALLAQRPGTLKGAFFFRLRLGGLTLAASLALATAMGPAVRVCPFDSDGNVLELNLHVAFVVGARHRHAELEQRCTSKLRHLSIGII